MTQTILLAGATGMFGSQIARQLQSQPGARLRLLVRASEDAKKKDALKPLLDHGAEFVEGDLADHASLDRATQGVDVIVSAVQGGPDVIIDGQIALAEAGKRNGVRRILPSDYAMDIFKATPGEHMMFDLRRKADDAIAKVGIEHIHVLQGAFMEMFGPKMGTFDYEAGTYSYWGDGNQAVDCTSVQSTASMVAHIALDLSVTSGKFAFAGDRISILDAAKVIEKQTGRTFTHSSLGSEADLRAAIAQAHKDTSNPFKPVMLAYQLYMLNGQTALTDLQNKRYADVKLESFAEFAKRTIARTTA
jgi:nucleoside-diphosphate-sugar epimerase